MEHHLQIALRIFHFVALPSVKKFLKHAVRYMVDTAFLVVLAATMQTIHFYNNGH